MAAPKLPVELTVITKTYDLILWSCNHTRNSPQDLLTRNLSQLLHLCVPTSIPQLRLEFSAAVDTGEMDGGIWHSYDFVVNR
jgi:hypothetical protein